MYISQTTTTRLHKTFTGTMTAWRLGGAGRSGGSHRGGEGWRPTGCNLRRDCCKWERNKRLLYSHMYIQSGWQFHSIIEPHTPALKLCLVRMCDRGLWHLTLYCVMEQQGIMLIDSYLCVIGPIYEVRTCAAVEVTLYGVCCEENCCWSSQFFCALLQCSVNLIPVWTGLHYMWLTWTSTTSQHLGRTSFHHGKVPRRRRSTGQCYTEKPNNSQEWYHVSRC